MATKITSKRLAAEAEAAKWRAIATSAKEEAAAENARILATAPRGTQQSASAAIWADRWDSKAAELSYLKELAEDLAAHGGLGDDPVAAVAAAHDRRQAFAAEMLEGLRGRAKMARQLLASQIYAQIVVRGCRERDLRHCQAIVQAMNDALVRSIAGALRSSIRDHGPITPEYVGSATKRVLGNLLNTRAPVAAAAAVLGRLGGKAGLGKPKRRSAEHYAAIGAKGGGATGASKRRPTAHYRGAAAGRWASMTAEERSAEMSRRRRKGLRRA